MSSESWILYTYWKVRRPLHPLIFLACTNTGWFGLLETWSAMDALPVSKTCRAVKLLGIRSFELKSGVHEVLDQVWKSLVHIDIDRRTIRIQKEGDGMYFALATNMLGALADAQYQATK